MLYTLNATVPPLAIEFYQEAEGYYHRALKFKAKGFSFELVFNVASMGLEKYLMALSLRFGIVPQNHTYTDLMDAVKPTGVVPTELEGRIRGIDKIFQLCSLENYHHGQPQESDMDELLKVCQGLKTLLSHQGL